MNPLKYRVGTGYDTHRLGADSPLLLGGVEIPHCSGLIGHSDADVLLHAITDAIFGAIGAGDIGEHFPDTAPENKNRDSTIFLAHAIALMNEQHYQIANLDCTLFAQKPKLKDDKPKIRAQLATLLKIKEEQINIKAKTGEHVGPVGREEAIQAAATILIQQVNLSQSIKKP